MQHLSRHATEVAELQEEVTRGRAATIMVESLAARAEEMAYEMVVLLDATRGEANEVAQRVFTLEGELGATRQACSVTKEKLPSLASQAATANRRRVGVEE
jgi:glycerate-2-kinase